MPLSWSKITRAVAFSKKWEREAMKMLKPSIQSGTRLFPGLNEKVLLRYILVSDFAKFRLHDFDKNTQNEFTIQELVNNVGLLSEIAGYKKRTNKK